VKIFYYKILNFKRLTMNISTKRIYTIADALLIALALEKIAFLRRDMANVIKFGVTADVINHFESTVNEYKNLPLDSEAEAQQMQKTAVKNALRAEIYAVVGDIFARAKLAFAGNSAVVDEFSAAAIRMTNDDAFISRARKVSSVAAKYLADLSVFGQTQAELTALAAQCNALEIALNDQKAAKCARSLAARERIKKGNELYSALVDFCAIGRRAYVNTNSTKYIDYVLYNSDAPRALPDDVAGMGYDAQAQKAYWNASAAEKRYEVEIKDSGVITEVTINKDFTELAIAMGASAKRVRIRGRNAAGVGSWSDWLEIPAAAQPPPMMNVQ